jgi:hypothetical protein
VLWHHQSGPDVGDDPRGITVKAISEATYVWYIYIQCFLYVLYYIILYIILYSILYYIILYYIFNIIYYIILYIYTPVKNVARENRFLIWMHPRVWSLWVVTLYVDV